MQPDFILQSGNSGAGSSPSLVDQTECSGPAPPEGAGLFTLGKQLE